MLRTRLLILPAVLLAVPGSCAWASEGDGRSLTYPPPPPAFDRQVESASPTPPAASTPPPQPSANALAPEIAERLAAGGGSVATAEREDRAALAKFYEARQHEPVWVAASALNPAGHALVAEIARADDWGLDASAFRLPNPPTSGREPTRTERADVEITLSLAVLKYARHARGGRAEPTSLSRNIDRQLSLLAPAQAIEAAAKAEKPDAYLRGLHPRHPQFELLRQKYLALKRGQPVAAADTDPDGKAGKRGSAPEGASAQKLLINMEQWRWMPDDLGDFYVWVNVPEFLIRVVKGGKVIHTERVVVGKPDTQTPIFSDEMEQVIFHPFWGVPDSIKKADIQPSLARGSIARARALQPAHPGRTAGTSIPPASTGPRPTCASSTSTSRRAPRTCSAWSSSASPTSTTSTCTTRRRRPCSTFPCARTATAACACAIPQRLAELLLADDQGWPASRVAAAINGGPPNNQINLKQQDPRAHHLFHRRGGGGRQAQAVRRHLRPREAHHAGP